MAYLVAQRKAARRIERQLRSQVGAGVFDGIFPVLAAIGGGEQPRMREYLRRARDLDDLGYVEP